jgi:serine/threonine protein phosphatase PrpC
VPSQFIYARRLASSRRHSEDRAEVIDRGGELVIAVADGAGGIRGAIASDALVEAASVAADDPSFDIEDTAQWSNVFRRTDFELAGKLRGECTGIVVVVTSRGLFGVSAGDSEACIVTNGGIDDLTAAQNRKRLGTGHASPVAFSREALDGLLIVGTDGLFKHAALERVAAVVEGRSPVEATESLLALVRLSSGAYPDDVGIVVVGAAPI